MTETSVAEVAGPPTDDPDPAGGRALPIPPTAPRLTPGRQSSPSDREAMSRTWPHRRTDRTTSSVRG
jgi:hypothetical protein